MKIRLILLTFGFSVCPAIPAEEGTGLQTKTLCEAVREGLLHEVVVHIASGADVNNPAGNVRSPLGYAVQEGRILIVDLLLEHGADLNARRHVFDDTPVMIAARDKNHEMVDYLLERGARFDIFDAIRVGYVPRIEQLIEEDGNVVDSLDDSGNTPLYAAASRRNAEVVRLLLDNGADVNYGAKRGSTPLGSSICSVGKAPIMKILLEAGADIHGRPGFTTIHQAAGIGDPEMVKLLIDAGADVNRPHYATGAWYPLHEAAAEGHLEVVKLLLEHGAEVNVSNRSGWTPLGQALREGHTAVAKILFDHGARYSIHEAVAEGEIGSVRFLIDEGRASVHDRNAGGETPLHLAAQTGKKEIAEFLIDCGAEIEARSDRSDLTPLHMAVERGNEEILKLLIERGADVNALSYGDRSPLHIATNRNDPSMFRLLLSNGADARARASNKRTCLHSLSHRGNEETVRLLIDHGADVNARGSMGETPLHHLAIDDSCYPGSFDVRSFRKRKKPRGEAEIEAATGSRHIAQLLLEKGAEVNAKDDDGVTPLHAAAWNGRWDIAGMLLDHGADRDAMSEKGTPIHCAAAGGYPAVTRYLLERGADPEARDEDGATPLHYAVRTGQKDAVPVLIEHGADVDAVDRHGDTPLHWAAKQDACEMVDFLVETGARLNEVNQRGMTPLALALVKGKTAAADRIRQLGGLEFHGRSVAGEGVRIGHHRDLGE